MSNLRLIPVDNLDLPELEPYRNQKDAWLRARHNPEVSPEGATGTGLADGLFMAEGELVVDELIRSPHGVVSILVASDRVDGLEPLLSRLPSETPIYVGSTSVLEGLLGFRMHRGLLACGRAKPCLTERDLLQTTQILIAAEDLANHDNVGGIFRCVRALGGRNAGVLLSNRCCDPFYRRALRVSIGHALHVPWAWADDWPGCLDRAREAGFAVLALTPGPQTVNLDDFAASLRPGSRVCLLAGAEGPGLTEAAMNRATARVRIPMDAAVDSLNVTVAVALSLHAVCANAQV